MAQHVFISFSRAIEGEAEAYEEWYDRQHMPDVLAVPGFVSGQRFRVVQRRPEETTRDYHYMIVYQLETDDVEASIAEMRARIGSGVIDTGGLFDPSMLGFYTGTEAAPKQFAKKD